MTSMNCKLPLAILGAALVLAGCEQTMTETGAAAMTGTPEEKCAAEVASRSGTADPTVTSAKPGEGGTVVSVSTSGSERWTCILNENGEVAEVFANKDGRR